MAKQRRKYEAAFKQEAVRLVREGPRPVAEVARDLGIHVNTLHTWVRELPTAERVAPVQRTHRNAADEKLRRLERELRRVTEERDILKKAVAFFASERK